MKYYLLEGNVSAYHKFLQSTILIKDDPENPFIKYLDHLVIKCKKEPSPDSIDLKRIVAFKNCDDTTLSFEKLVTYEKGKFFKRKTIFWVVEIERKIDVDFFGFDSTTRRVASISRKGNLKIVKTLEFDSDDDAKLWFEVQYK